MKNKSKYFVLFDEKNEYLMLDCDESIRFNDRIETTNPLGYFLIDIINKLPEIIDTINNFLNYIENGNCEDVTYLDFSKNTNFKPNLYRLHFKLEKFSHFFYYFNIADECIEAYSKKVKENEELKLSLLEQLKRNKTYEKIHSDDDYNYNVYKEDVIDELETKYYKSEIEAFEKKKGFSNEDDLEKRYLLQYHRPLKEDLLYKYYDKFFKENKKFYKQIHEKLLSEHKEEIENETRKRYDEDHFKNTIKLDKEVERIYKKRLKNIYKENIRNFTIKFLKNFIRNISLIKFRIIAYYNIDYDTENQEFNQLNNFQRLFAYDLYHNIDSKISVPNSIFTMNIIGEQKLSNRSYFSKILKSTNNWGDIMQDIRKKDIKYEYKYELLTFIDFMNISFLQILLNNKTISRCKNCGKYFIPTNKSNETLCDNIYKNRKNM